MLLHNLNLRHKLTLITMLTSVVVPLCRSRTKTSPAWLLSSATRSVASLSKAR